MSDTAEAVRVVVRCRPLFGKEVCEKRESIVDVDIATNSVNIQNPGRKGEDGKRFTFDAVYNKDATQKGFYDESAYPIVEGVLEGFNGTIFAYGQTGCGKTHTMQGYSDPPDMRGVIPNSFEHVYEAVKADGGQKEFLVRCSYLEIYNEDVRDLLGANPKQKLELKENADRGVYVKDLTQVVVEDVQAISEVMQKGFEQRSVGSTAMNATSSRSHSIFTIVVEVNEAGDDGQEHFRAGKLNLVDLAGSERQSKTGATGDRLKEGCKINLSLSALGNVISALVDGRSKHIPYRDSKLTRLLQDSLGGNTKTLMVACVSPADYNYEETISTLRYANRAKNIKNKPTINEDPKDAMLRQYKSELEQLRKLLEEHKSGGGASAGGGLQQPSGPQVATSGGIDPQNRSQLLKALQDLDGSMHRMSITTADVVTSPQHGSPAHKRADDGAADVGNINGSAGTPLVMEKQVPIEVKQVVEVEVESAAAKAEREALSQYNEAVVAQRDAMGADLQKKALEVANERELREAVESKLKALQSKMLGGLKGLTPVKGRDGETEHDPEVILARKNAEFRRAQHKLKAQRKKEALLEAQRKQVEAEKEAVEEAARASQEDAQARLKSHKARERKLKVKLESARAEIRDLSEEFQDERELMLNTIRDQTKQIQLLKQLAELAFPPSTISRVYEKARWDENTGLWELPRIKVGGRPASADMGVPKLPGLGDQADKENRNARKRAKRREGRRRSAEADVGDGKSEDALASELAGREVYSRPASRPASQCRPSSSRYGRRPSAKERPDSAARGGVIVQQQQAGARPCSSAQPRRGSGLGEPQESGGAQRDGGGAHSKEPSCPTSLLVELRKRITAVAPDLRQAFDQFDENGDGVIGRSEFKRALERMGLELPDNVGRALRKHIDKNDDKKISFGELQAFMQVGALDPAAT